MKLKEYVEEEGRLTLRDKAGTRLSTVCTVGFYPYRVAQVHSRVATIREVNTQYDGKSDWDNHRVYVTREGHFVQVDDWTVQWALEITRR